MDRRQLQYGAKIKFLAPSWNWAPIIQLIIRHYTDWAILAQYKNEQLTPCSSLSWKASSQSVGKETSNLLQNPKVYYHIHKSLPLVPILSQMNSFHILIPCSFIIQFNITISSMPWSPKKICTHIYSKCHVTLNKAKSNLECAEEKFQTRGWVRVYEKWKAASCL
jgi:hypothetical protein